MSKYYRVLQSCIYGEWIEVKAKNEKQAIQKVKDADYTDEDIVDFDVISREVTGDVEESGDE